MTTPTSDFYLTLPSNASTSMYPKNGPSGFKVALPNVYELHGDEWQVGLASLVYPHTWVNMPGSTAEELKEFRHQGVFYARIFSRRRPVKYKYKFKYPDEYWVALHVAQGHYRTLGDFLKGIRQALRDEFGEGLADQDFKFNFDEDAKRVTITIKAWSCLALNPWMTNLLHSGNFGMYGITKRRFAEWNNDFSLLGDNEYAEVDGKKPTKELIDAIITDTPFLTYTIGEPSDKVFSWRASHLAFQTIYIYSDVVASQVVGDLRANLLRVIAPKGSHGDVISENFVHVFYNDVRVKSFNTVEILLRGDTGRPIPFSGGVVEVTLHFKKK